MSDERESERVRRLGEGGGKGNGSVYINPFGNVNGRRPYRYINHPGLVSARRVVCRCRQPIESTDLVRFCFLFFEKGEAGKNKALPSGPHSHQMKFLKLGVQHLPFIFRVHAPTTQDQSRRRLLVLVLVPCLQDGKARSGERPRWLVRRSSSPRRTRTPFGPDR